MSKYGKITIEAPSEWEEELTMLLFEAGALGIAVDDPALIKAHLERGDWDASVYDAMQITTGRLTITATFTAEQTAQAAEEIAAQNSEHIRDQLFRSKQDYHRILIGSKNGRKALCRAR